MSDKTFLEQYILNENEGDAPSKVSKKPDKLTQMQIDAENRRLRSKENAEWTKKITEEKAKAKKLGVRKDLESDIRKRVSRLQKKFPFKFPQGPTEKLIKTLLKDADMEFQKATKAIEQAAKKPMSRRGMSVKDRFGARFPGKDGQNALRAATQRGKYKNPAKVYRAVSQKTVGRVWNWLWGSIRSLWKAGKLKAVDAFKDGLLKGLGRVLWGAGKFAMGGTIVGGFLLAVDVFFLAFEITRAVNKIVTITLRKANLERHPWLNGKMMYDGEVGDPNAIADLLTPDKDYIEQMVVPWLVKSELIKYGQEMANQARKKIPGIGYDASFLYDDFRADAKRIAADEKKRMNQIKNLNNAKNHRNINDLLTREMEAEGIMVGDGELYPGQNYRGTAGSDSVDPKAKRFRRLKRRPKAGGTLNPRPVRPAIGIGDGVQTRENKENNDLLKIINEEIDKILG